MPKPPAANITIDSSAVDTTTIGSYPVYISVADTTPNVTTVIRTVIVEFAYPNWTGIIPTKTTQRVGSANPLLWAWLDENYQPIDTSADIQHLSIRNCAPPYDIVVDMAGYPGSSGFRFKSDYYWQFNWDSEGTRGEQYCAFVTSDVSGQTQISPPIRLR